MTRHALLSYSFSTGPSFSSFALAVSMVLQRRHTPQIVITHTRYSLQVFASETHSPAMAERKTQQVESAAKHRPQNTSSLLLTGHRTPPPSSSQPVQHPPSLTESTRQNSLSISQLGRKAVGFNLCSVNSASTIHTLTVVTQPRKADLKTKTSDAPAEGNKFLQSEPHGLCLT